MPEKCAACFEEEVRPWDETCPVCGEAVPETPNVRAATQQEEREALHRRYLDAVSEIDPPTVAEFEAAIHSARPVINRSESFVLAFINDENGLYVSFYKQVDAGVRRPEESEIDTERRMADQRLFPNYFEKICFGALSIDSRGVPSYGDCALVFREQAIRKRATLFEENSLDFCRRHQFASVPPGYRANWQQKGKLAVAKLKERLKCKIRAEDFAEILLPRSPKGSQRDFLEVHIYGVLHRKAVERIALQKSGKKPTRADKILQRKIDEVVQMAGLSVIVDFV